jgi:hypothetical protein
MSILLPFGKVQNVCVVLAVILAHFPFSKILASEPSGNEDFIPGHFVFADSTFFPAPFEPRLVYFSSVKIFPISSPASRQEEPSVSPGQTTSNPAVIPTMKPRYIE